MAVGLQWNRERMPQWNQTWAPKFVAGPAPRNSLAPTEGVDALYSGLLECPLTTRVRKIIQANYVVKHSGPACADMGIQTAAECFEAATKLFPNTTLSTRTVSNAFLPAGCSLERAPTGSIDVTFNKDAKGTAAAGCGGASTSVSGTAKSLVQLHIALDKPTAEVRITMVGPATVWYLTPTNTSLQHTSMHDPERKVLCRSVDLPPSVCLPTYLSSASLLHDSGH